MFDTLKKNGHNDQYLEIVGGDHCLTNQQNRTDLITL